MGISFRAYSEHIDKTLSTEHFYWRITCIVWHYGQWISSMADMLQTEVISSHLLQNN